jgi:hypothetical protein
MKKLLITLALLTVVTGASAQCMRYHYKGDSATNARLQRENDSLIICADRYQLRVDMNYRDHLLADSNQMQRLSVKEIRYLTDTAVTESRNILYLQETWFRNNYGVHCGAANEAFKQ